MIERLLRAIFPMSFLHRMLELYLSIDKREREAATGYVFFQGKMLVIRQSYGTQRWTYPGGFVHPKEVPETGLRREVFEEVGLLLTRVKLIEKTTDSRKNHNITVHRFYAEAKTDKTIPDKVEVLETKWVPFEELSRYVSGDHYIERAKTFYTHYAYDA
ncbi:MAG: NUDIX hydrolase [Candidatus Paceibacterota bacterium]